MDQRPSEPLGSWTEMSTQGCAVLEGWGAGFKHWAVHAVHHAIHDALHVHHACTREFLEFCQKYFHRVPPTTWKNEREFHVFWEKNRIKCGFLSFFVNFGERFYLNFELFCQENDVKIADFLWIFLRFDLNSIWFQLCFNLILSKYYAIRLLNLEIIGHEHQGLLVKIKIKLCLWPTTSTSQNKVLRCLIKVWKEFPRRLSDQFW